MNTYVKPTQRPYVDRIRMYRDRNEALSEFWDRFRRRQQVQGLQMHFTPLDQTPARLDGTWGDSFQ